MALPTSDIQTALIARYNTDATITGLLGDRPAIYDLDGVPINTQFPYAVVFTVREQVGTIKAFGLDAVDSWVQISIFTQSQGFKLARSIAERVYDLTQDNPLVLSNGFTNVFIRFDSKSELTEHIEPSGDFPIQEIELRFHLKTQG